MIQTVSQATDYLAQFKAKTAQTTGKGITVGRMWPLLKLVDNPERKLKVIHIAGTSGKTSTGYFVASLLQQSGQKVGLTVSPHIRSVTERLQINGKPLEDDEFCRLLNIFAEIIGDDVDATYFEILIAFILWAFVELKVEYAVIETGLGGLHDGTNVCRRADKVCIITDIGLDHQLILGETLEEIALQKIGILHKGNIAFANNQPKEIQEVFREYSAEVGANFNVIESKTLDIPLPKYQIRNWNLAYETYKYIANRDNLGTITETQIANTFIGVPGRMHELEYCGTKFVLDGAHNVQKMTAFVDSFKAKYPGQKVTAILSIKEDKDYNQVVKILSEIIKKALCVGFEIKQDMPIKSINPVTISEVCATFGIESEVMSSINSAIDRIVECKESVVIVTGSLYILGSVLEIIENTQEII